MSSDDEVGYGKPPKATQFKPGQSGNRKGRPRGSRNVATMAKTILMKRVTVREAGESRRMSRAEAFLRMLTNKARAGDQKARDILTDLQRHRGVFEPPPEPSQRPGVLLVPATLTPEEWLIEAEKVRERQLKEEYGVPSKAPGPSATAPLQSTVGRRHD
jgi:hypothetical protein